MPTVKAGATDTATKVVSAADTYERTDEMLGRRIEARNRTGTATAENTASCQPNPMGQMGQLMGMPMQMAQQAAQIPQQVGGMVASLPQSAMQGAQQVGEQVQQIVEQFSDKESKDGESKPEERSEAGERGERAPADKPSRSAEDNAAINL